MTIRVYEFSKQSGIPSRDLLQVLHEAGFDVASHMSILADDQLAFLKKKYLEKKSSSADPGHQARQATADCAKILA